jgi:hypothetical protein
MDHGNWIRDVEKWSRRESEDDEAEKSEKMKN